MQTQTTLRQVDHNAIRTNQAFMIGLLALTFVLDLPALALLTGLIALVSALAPPLGLFTRVYRHVLRPLGLPADIIDDNPEPHRFAQTVGGTLVTLGSALVLAGVTFGWAFNGVVLVLAGLNLFAGWCAGCTMYYWFNRLGVPGFERAPVDAVAEVGH